MHPINDALAKRWIVVERRGGSAENQKHGGGGDEALDEADVAAARARGVHCRVILKAECGGEFSGTENSFLGTLPRTGLQIRRRIVRRRHLGQFSHGFGGGGNLRLRSWAAKRIIFRGGGRPHGFFARGFRARPLDLDGGGWARRFHLAIDGLG